jgi:hypothetical protein
MTHPKYVMIGSPETKVMEECAEVIQAICKAERFGWDSHHPDYPPEKTNAIVIWEEMDDVVARMQELKKRLTELGLEPFKLRAVPDKSHLMSMKAFVQNCIAGTLTDIRGHAFYALDQNGVIMMSDKLIKPSYVMTNERAPLDARFGWIVWFNKYTGRA